MENENKSVWGKILKVVITVLTAIATTFGFQRVCKRLEGAYAPSVSYIYFEISVLNTTT